MRNRLFIGSVVLITLIAFEAMSVMAIMPSVVRDLHGLALFPLASGVPLAAQVFTTTLAGSWSDTRGALGPLLTGLGLFAGGLALCALAPNMVVFVVGRTIQGLGGGLLMVPLYVLAGQLLSARELPKFFAVASFAWVMPSLIGPFLAGVIDHTVGWRWVFGGVAPLAVIAALPFFGIFAHVEKVHAPWERTMVMRSLLALGAGVSLAALQTASGLEGWQFWAVIAGGGLGAILVMPQILPRGTFLAAAGLGSIALMRLLTVAIEGVGDSFIPLVLVNYWGWSVVHAGLAITAGAVTWALASWVQSRVTSVTKRDRLPTWGALIALVGTLATLVVAFPAAGTIPVIIVWGIANFGVGLVLPPLAVTALEITPTSRHGRVSAYIQTADAAGPALAMALVSVAFQYTMHLEQPYSYAPAWIAIVVCTGLGLFASTRIQAAKLRAQSAGEL